MNFGSLFAGIGGLDLGLERAGMTCKWQVEIDDYATRVLAKHWPNVPRYRDVREVGKHNLEPVDLICGGFPCQDISNAGKRAGIDGERSGLWSEYFRIVCELRPRYVLVENVAALLERGIGRVLGDLATGGYDAEWECLPASAIGASHLRDRVYIVAHSPRIVRNEMQAHAVRCEQGMGAQGQSGGRYFTQVPPRRSWQVDQSPFRGAVNGVPVGLDGLKGLGNAVVPAVAEWIGNRIMQSI